MSERVETFVANHPEASVVDVPDLAWGDGDEGGRKPSPSHARARAWPDRFAPKTRGLQADEVVGSPTACEVRE